MRVAGICVEITARGRPMARLVVVDDAAGAPTVDRVADFPSDNVDIATQLHDGAEAVKSRLTGLAVDRVVVRRADRPPRPSNQEGPRMRLLMEGAIVSAARSVVIDTRVGTGKDTGTWFGSTKAGVDAAAESLLQAQRQPLPYKEATAAALAGLNAP